MYQHPMSSIYLIVILFVNINSGFGQCILENEIVVAQDGTGDFETIQAAIDASTSSGSSPFVIYIKNGVYDEKLYFEKSNITLIGQDRELTIITTAELRRVWRETHDNDWGAATINISNSATDLTFANMTIRNNFADVYPDFPNPNDHTFAIRGGGNRIITVNCNIIATGGDTLSLWNTNGGMFYHKNCYIEGYVDFIAPRGYCYMEDCTFYGYNSTASIWHDGSGGEDHKLVIKNGFFDGKPGFALGRHHRDAQFYLIDCFFTENMKNQEIYWEGQNEISWSPDRKYYYNCHRPVFDWSWHKNNLHEDPYQIQPHDINASWTFNNEWNPEALLNNLWPFASLPSPYPNDCLSTSGLLSWVSGRCADAHIVYLGIENPEKIATTQESSLEVEGLEEGRKYQWRVDEIVGSDTIVGEVWTFHTETTSSPLPAVSFQPNPPDDGAYFDNVVRLEWDYDPCSVDSFLVYFGRSGQGLTFRGIQEDNFYITSDRKSDTTYLWRVDTKNKDGITEGQVWTYVYDPSPSDVLEVRHPDFKVGKITPNPFSGDCVIEIDIPFSGELQVALLDTQGIVLQNSINLRVPAGAFSYPVNIGNYKGIVFGKFQFAGDVRWIKLVSQ